MKITIRVHLAQIYDITFQVQSFPAHMVLKFQPLTEHNYEANT